MPGRLSLQECAQLAACCKVWRSVVQVQRWWTTIKGRHSHADTNMIKNCHAKLIATGPVADTLRRGGRSSNSRDPEVVQVVQEMFT